MVVVEVVVCGGGGMEEVRTTDQNMTKCGR